MKKNKNGFVKFSNFLFVLLFIVSIIQIFLLVKSGGNIELNGDTVFSKSDYIANLIFFSGVGVFSLLILFVSNKHMNIFNDEYSTSRKLFNLFVEISAFSFIISIISCILNVAVYKMSQTLDILTLLIGYVPSFLVAIYCVSKKDLLSINNSKKTNVTNFLIIYLMLDYYLNFIIALFSMMFNVGDLSYNLSQLVISLLFVCILLLAYKLFERNDKIERENELKKEVKVVDEKKIKKETSKKTTNKNTSKQNKKSK